MTETTESQTTGQYHYYALAITTQENRSSCTTRTDFHVAKSASTAACNPHARVCHLVSVIDGRTLLHQQLDAWQVAFLSSVVERGLIVLRSAKKGVQM